MATAPDAWCVLWQERMEHGLQLLMGHERAGEVQLVLSKDGSGVGAAIIAAIAEK